MAISIFPAGATGAKIQKVDKITSTQSWTAPSDVTEVEVIICGGGGGGYGDPINLIGAGGGGSVFYEILTVVPNTSYTITIGAGGAGGSDGGGSNGSSTTFGALFTATGGDGGDNNATSPKGLAGGATFVNTTSPGLGAGGSAGFMGFGQGGGSGEAGLGSAQPNTGNGGRTALNNGTAGGSGVAIIKYWSAA